MGFSKEFFEMIVKKYGAISNTTEEKDNFFYLYSKDKTNSQGYESWEEVSNAENPENGFKLIPHDGVLEIVDLDASMGNDQASDFISYEDIIRFNVGIFHGTGQ